MTDHLKITTLDITKEIWLLQAKYCAVVRAIYEQNGKLMQTSNEICEQNMNLRPIFVFFNVCRYFSLLLYIPLFSSGKQDHSSSRNSFSMQIYRLHQVEWAV